MEIIDRFNQIKEIDREEKKTDMAARLEKTGRKGESSGDPTDPDSGDESEEGGPVLEFSQLEQHVLIDPETATPKEVSHVIAAHIVMTKYLPLMIEDYNENMQEFKMSCGANQPNGAWAAILPLCCLNL